MVLTTKWLESGEFVRPPIRDGSMRLKREEFARLMAGLDWTRVGSSSVMRPARAAEDGQM